MTPPARIGRCNRELKPKVHTVKGVHTFFYVHTLYLSTPRCRALIGLPAS